MSLEVKGFRMYSLTVDIADSVNKNKMFNNPVAIVISKGPIRKKCFLTFLGHGSMLLVSRGKLWLRLPPT